MSKTWLEGGQFKELPSSEVAELSNDMAASYLKDLQTNKETELKGLIDSAESKGKDNAEAIKNLTSVVEEIKEKSINAILKAVKDQGEVLKSRMESGNINKNDFSSALKSVIKESATEIKSVIAGTSKGTNEMQIKADVTTASVQGSTASMRLSGIGKQPVRRVFLEGLFSSGRVSSNSGGTITYWDQDTLVRNADNVAECGLIPESEINWQEYSCKVEKIADSIPVCEEALEDYDFIESEIRNFLLENVLLKLDQQILFGTGTTPQLKGIDATAQTWVAGSFAALVPDANIVDVIKVAKCQIEASGENNAYMPNVVLMNPADKCAMEMLKDADGNSLNSVFTNGMGSMVDGLEIVSSPLVAANTMYVMDSSKATVYNHRDLGIQVANQHDQDFMHDRLRLKATLRKAFVIRNVNANGFLKVDDISAAIAAILKP